MVGLFTSPFFFCKVVGLFMNKYQHAPLADRMRPRNFSEFVGQNDIVGEGKLLRKLVENDELASLIFWGPPGVGKTTLAQIIANQTSSHFTIISAVAAGKADLMSEIKEAKQRLLDCFRNSRIHTLQLLPKILQTKTPR